MKIFLPILFLSFFNKAVAQKSETLQQHDKLIRLNFTSLFDPLETNFSAGLEYRLKDRTAVSLDLGYIFFDNNLNDRATKASGIILRPAIRYYTDNKKRFYIEGELHIKSLTTTLQDWIGRGVVNNVSTYEEFAEFKIRKNVVGLNFKIGYQARLSKDNKLWLEPYIGFGIKRKNKFLLNEPNSNYDINDIFNNGLVDNRLTQILPNVAFGARFLIKI